MNGWVICDPKDQEKTFYGVNGWAYPRYRVKPFLSEIKPTRGSMLGTWAARKLPHHTIITMAEAYEMMTETEQAMRIAMMIE